MRKIVVVTGTRADYGIYRPVLNELSISENLELFLIVTGMHLSEDHGYTINDIEKDGYEIAAKVPVVFQADTTVSMAKDVGTCILGLTDYFEKIGPDILLVLGDRGEMLAAAITGIYMNIPVAHIHGGEVSGTVDESVRHAITKLSHIHFTATGDSAERIRKMGENDFRIHVVGAPALDTILSMSHLSKKDISSMLSLDPDKEIILLVQHPVTTEYEQVEKQIRETMEALIEIGEQTVVIYPNADAGGKKIIEVIEQYRKYPFIRIFKSLGHEEYLSLMRVADVMVGNSSSGIIESSSFGLPVVNIGSRQKGRLRAENVIDAESSKESILKSIKTALYDENFRKVAEECTNPYGDGNAGKRIVSILENLEINSKLLQKKISY